MRHPRAQGNSQDRRRTRRARARRAEHGLNETDVRELHDLIASAIKPAGWGEPGADPVADIIETIEAAVSGKGKRLKGSDADGDDDAEQDDEEKKKGKPDTDKAALDAIDEFAASVQCACGHLFSEHNGAGGTCAHEDGRGTCRCGEFAYPVADVAAIAAAIIEARPEMAEFSAEVMRLAQRVLLSTHTTADIAWDGEASLGQLLDDITQSLPRGQALDVSVDLDRTVIAIGEDGAARFYIAPLAIDAMGDPVVADQADWILVTDEEFAKGYKFAPTVEMPEAAEELPETSDEITPPPAAASGDIPWHATFVPEGKLTEDGRAFAPGSVLIPGVDEGARDLPLSLMAMIETSAEGGHDGAKVAGRIDDLYRVNAEQPQPDVEADGVFSNEEWGQMIARMVENKELTGLSVDIAPLDYSWVPRAQFFDESGDFIGVWDDAAEAWAPAPGTETEEEEGEPSLLDLFFGEDDRVLLINRAVIGMATVCPFPAFGDAEIALTAAGMPYKLIVPLQMSMPVEALTAAGIEPCEECHEAEIEIVKPQGPVLTAAAAGHAPLAPPAEWFDNPEFAELTPFTIADDGRVFGHAWQWETCHLSFDRCVTAPHSKTEYAYFMTGETQTEDGSRLQVGKITYDTGHAGTSLSRGEAVRHYDDTGTLAALVQFGEDEFGGWFAGSIVADMPDEDLQRVRACGVSGDWRGIDGNLELVALLSVPVGGFPVPRGAVTAAGDQAEPLSLVAAGVVTDSRLAHIKAMVNEALIGDLTARAEE